LIVIADRLQINGQADRELVLSRLYLLHAFDSNTGCPEVTSCSCFTKENISMPTVVRVTEHRGDDVDLMSEPSDDAARYCVPYCVTYGVYFLCKLFVHKQTFQLINVIITSTIFQIV